MSDWITDLADEQAQELSACWDKVVELINSLEAARGALNETQAALAQANQENQKLRQQLAGLRPSAPMQPMAATVSHQLLIDGGEGDYTTGLTSPRRLPGGVEAEVITLVKETSDRR
jgi:hypothetical protein